MTSDTASTRCCAAWDRASCWRCRSDRQTQSLVNEFYRRALRDSTIDLTILTALSC